MKLLLAILVGKIISKIIRLLKIGGGSAAPGLYALKIEPDLVEKLAERIPQNVVITGTNGKTTTARILTHLAKDANTKVIRNHTGSNLERGIASTLIQSLNVNVFHTRYVLSGHIGIWEMDEAAFNVVTPKIKPDIIVFLNVFRDQLDRYGEVNSVVERWCNTLKTLTPQTIVLVNGDDSNTARLAQCFKGKTYTFGVEGYKIAGESLVQTKQQRLDFEAKNVKLKGLNGSSFSLFINRKSYIINLPLPGIYHIYDAVAAISAFSFLTDTPIHRHTNTLKSFSPAFGRVEKLPFGYIFLIKNPAGATQVFETIAPQLKEQDRLLLALNDNLADGTDVSWIWDGEFEALHQMSHDRGTFVAVSGKRAFDLAIRLKYAGFDPKLISIEQNLEIALKQARQGLKGRLFILPTYTAMLELQSILARSGIKKHYWTQDI